MPIRTIDEARVDLATHIDGLGALLDAAHQEFREKCREIAPVLDMRSRASIYRDIIVKGLREYCDATSKATFLRRGQLCLAGLENKYVLRAKRLRNGFSVGVSKTVASETYDANEVPESVVDLLPADSVTTCLYLGWAVSENAPNEISKYLVCNDGDRHLAWAIPLGGDDGSVAVQELPLAPTPAGDVPRVRVKGAPKRKANE